MHWALSDAVGQERLDSTPNQPILCTLHIEREIERPDVRCGFGFVLILSPGNSDKMGQSTSHIQDERDYYNL